jgi:flagellar motor switch protein FliN/FliY
MSKATLTKAGEAVKALLSTMLGESAPLNFGALQPVQADDLREDAQALLGIVPDSGDYAVLLDPSWLPLIAGLKLGVQTRVGDEDFEDIVRELAGLFVSAVATHFATSGAGEDYQSRTLQVKEPGEPLAPEVSEHMTGRLPFFMEWDGVILHGFALMGPIEDADHLDDSSEAPESIHHTTPAPSSMASSPQRQDSIKVQSAAFPDLGKEAIGENGFSGLGLLADVELEVTVELGRRRMPLSDILRLTNGSVLELEKLVGEPLQIFANNRFIAEGEAVVIDDQFGVRITALASRSTEKILR